MGIRDLHRTMNGLARDTWNVFRDSDDFRLQFHEPGVTDHLLLSLRRSLSSMSLPMQVVQVSSYQENRIGADVEFWIALDDGRYFGYSIQAKRSRVKDVIADVIEYPAIDHEVGTRAPREQQFDLLIRMAQQRGVHPVHVFYNGWSTHRSGPGVPYGSTERMIRSRPYFGCAAIPSQRVQTAFRAAPTRGQSLEAATYTPWTVPWSHLFLVNGWLGTGHLQGTWQPALSKLEREHLYLPRETNGLFSASDVAIIGRQYRWRGLRSQGADRDRSILDDAAFSSFDSQQDRDLFADRIPIDVALALSNGGPVAAESKTLELAPPLYAVVVGQWG
jgi:hypothetical protein